MNVPQIRPTSPLGPSASAQPRATGAVRVALGGLAVLAALALLALTPGAQAGGTGIEILTDPPGDAAAQGPTSDWIRLGASSDATNVYIHINTAFVGYPAEPPNPTANIQFEIGWCSDNVSYFVQPTLLPTGVWQGKNLYTAGSCAVAAAGAGPNALPAPTWVCTEAWITLPRSYWNAPPTVMTGLYTVSWAGGTAGATFDNAVGTGSYTLGTNGATYQAPPALVSAQAVGDNTVRVSWTQPDNGALPVSSFRIYRSLDGVSYALLGTAAAGSTSYDDIGLATGTTYHYKVANVSCPDLPAQPGTIGGLPGESLPSTSASVSPDFRPAPATGFAVGTPTSSSLKLTWTAAAYDCPNASPCPSGGAGGSGVRGYRVLRGATAGTEAFLADLTLPGAPAFCTGTSCSFTDTGLSASTQYCYILRTFDGYASGPNLSAATSSACRTTSSSGGTGGPSCAADVGSTGINSPVTFTGSGGDGTFSWSGGGSPATGAPSTAPWSTAFPTAGSKTITVTSAGSSGTCGVSITGGPACTLDFFAPTPVKVNDVIAFSRVGAGATATDWHWEFGDGTSADGQAATHAFTTPGSYNVRFTRTDSDGCFAVRERTIEVWGNDSFSSAEAGSTPAESSAPPVVHATSDASATEGETVRLFATVEGRLPDEVTYTWRQVSGPAVTLRDATSAAPSFEAPALGGAGEPAYVTFGVRVSDGLAQSLEDTVRILIQPDNHRPVADTGDDQTVAPGETLTLDGEGSFDADADALTYTWTVVPPPGYEQAGVALEGLPTSGPTPTVTVPADVAVPFVDVMLTVEDGAYASADSVRIWIQVPGEPPLAFLATAQADGTVIFVAAAQAESYTWDFGDGSPPTTTTEPTTSHRYAVADTYTVTLRVSDAAEPASRAVTATMEEKDPIATEGTGAGVPGWVWGAVFALGAAALVGGLLVWALRHRGQGGPPASK